MNSPPLPGEVHPAYADRANVIRSFSQPRGHLAIATDNGVSQITLERKKAAQSLYPKYGFYVWHFWVDEFGRYIAEEDVVWKESPDAILQPEWNPVD